MKHLQLILAGIKCSKIWICVICLVLFYTPLYGEQGLKLPQSKIVLQLRWHPQFQFAGYYAAKEKKYYQQEGLQVEIRPGSFELNTVEEVVAGRAHFGVTNSEILLYRLRDKSPVMVVCPIFQHSPLVFLTRKTSEIRNPQDFIGKRIKMTRQTRDLELHAMLLNEGVTFDRFQMIEGPWEKSFLSDLSVDAVAVYATNEPYYYILGNVEFHLIYPSSYGIDFYGDTIFTSQMYAEKLPERVKAFRRASIKGWEYAMANQQEMIDLIIREYGSTKTKDHLAYEAKQMERLIKPGLLEIGQNNKARWIHIAHVFRQSGQVESLDPDPLKGFFFDDMTEGMLFWSRYAVWALSGGIFLFALVIVALFIFNKRLNREVVQKEESQKALAESEARLNAIFENIYSGLVILRASENGSDFIIRNFNKAALRIENVTLGDVIGEPFAKRFPQVKESGLLEVVKRVHQTGNPEHLPTRRYENKQIVEWRENYIYKLPSGEIAVVCNEETVRKIAEISRKHMDTINHIIINTRHTSHMLQNLLDAMLDIFECDRAWLLYPFDPSSDHFAFGVESVRPGYPSISDSDEKIVNTPSLAESIKRLLESDQPVVYDKDALIELYGDKVDQYQIQSEIRMAIYPKIDQTWCLGMHRCQSRALWTTEDRVLFNSIGRRISDGLNSILLIDELKTANQTLRESEDRFEKIFHSSPMGLLLVTGDQLEIITVNQSCLKLAGLSEKELIGHSLLEKDFLIDPEYMPVIEMLKLRDTQHQADIMFLKQSSEPMAGRLSSQTVMIDGKKCIIVALEDITEYKKAQKERQEAHQHAAEQEKYALIGQVAGKMAHDFNNILGAIMGNAELSIIDCENAEYKRIFELILEQTKRGRNLTRNLVAFAKDQEPRQDYFDLNEKIELVLNLLRKDLDNIRISRFFSSPLPELLADPGMIENALVNIIHNAIHAMSKTKEPHLIIRTKHDQTHIQVEVMDNGCGIPKEHFNSIYTPAFTLKNIKDMDGAYDVSIKGTGYGLFNVKKIVEKHKGKIRFESEVNKGTVFSMSFPIIKRNLTEEEKTEVEKTLVFKHKKILLVEDERSIFDVQSMILGSDPFFHKVDVAENADMAMAFLEKESYDLISLDYLLPGHKNGMDLYNIIRKTDVNVPILFISGNIEFLESIMALTQKDTLLDYLSKPCQNKVYVNAINSLLERSIIQSN